METLQDRLTRGAMEKVRYIPTGNKGVSLDDVSAIIAHTIAETIKAGVSAIKEHYQDEHPMENGVPVETYGYEETHNQGLTTAITALQALGKPTKE